MARSLVFILRAQCPCYVGKGAVCIESRVPKSERYGGDLPSGRRSLKVDLPFLDKKEWTQLLPSKFMKIVEWRLWRLSFLFRVVLSLFVFGFPAFTFHGKFQGQQKKIIKGSQVDIWHGSRLLFHSIGISKSHLLTKRWILSQHRRFNHNYVATLQVRSSADSFCFKSLCTISALAASKETATKSNLVQVPDCMASSSIVMRGVSWSVNKVGAFEKKNRWAEFPSFNETPEVSRRKLRLTSSIFFI